MFELSSSSLRCLEERKRHTNGRVARHLILCVHLMIFWRKHETMSLICEYSYLSWPEYLRSYVRMARSSECIWLLFCSLNMWCPPPPPSEMDAQSPFRQWQHWPCFLFSSNTQISSFVVYVSYCRQSLPLPLPSWCIIKLLSRFGRLIARVSKPWPMGLQTYLVTPPLQRHVCTYLSFLFVVVTRRRSAFVSVWRIPSSFHLLWSLQWRWTVAFPGFCECVKCENVVKELQLMVRGSGCVEASNYSIERGTFCSWVYGQNIGRGERVGTRSLG